MEGEKQMLSKPEGKRRRWAQGILFRGVYLQETGRNRQQNINSLKYSCAYT
jgi:hypothetical protein